MSAPLRKRPNCCTAANCSDGPRSCRRQPDRRRRGLREVPISRENKRQVIPRGWKSNAYDYLPDCFDHQLWLILVDIMAAVFGHEEARVRDERRKIFVRRTQDQFQCVRREPLRLLRQVERTRMGENSQWHRTKWRGRGRLAHHGVIFSVADDLEIAVARDGLAFLSLPERTLRRTRAAHRSGVNSVSSISE